MQNLYSILLFFSLLPLVLITSGCRRNSNVVWEDTKSAGRHMNRGLNALGGKHGDSRQVRSRGEFMGDPQNMPVGTYGGEFIPLGDDPNMSDISMQQMARPPKEMPGEAGSTIPGINAFRDPTTNPKWSGVFRNIHFDYNSTLVKGEQNLQTIRNIARFMADNPNTYVFIEGHCDERGPEAYNLALGSNRANGIRNLLINEGVNSDHLFTISYGRERPIIIGHDEESWQQNRRGEFKIYER